VILNCRPISWEIQYTWNSGYDPSGFIRFFDKMVTTTGYVEGASWFYDHSPSYESMVEAEREMKLEYEVGQPIETICRGTVSKTTEQ
jgi:hypothetical protein